MADPPSGFILFVDTSYLSHMSPAEKADFSRLLEHAKACVQNLDTEPRLEIHISEIALREYRCQLTDNLKAAISQLNTKMNALRREWHSNELAKHISPSAPVDESLMPSKEEIAAAGEALIDDLMGSGIQRIDIQPQHNEQVIEKYFNWEGVFEGPHDSEKANKEVRKARRTHIPDAWILESAIEQKNPNLTMLCLSDDGNLTKALEEHGYSAHNVAADVLSLLFPPPVPAEEDPAEALTSQLEQAETNTQDCPLESILQKSLNDSVKEINLRILGFTAVLDTPSHESLYEAVTSRGFDRKLVKACAELLSDGSSGLIRDTGSHYIPVNTEICNLAAERLTDEVIALMAGG